MSTIAERLLAVDTKLNNILSNANTQLTNKGKTTVSDLSELPSAVGELKNPTGTKSITQNGTVDVSNYANANVNVPTPEPNLQSKSIEITENGTETITADTGYDGLDEVEVVTNVSGGESEYNAKIQTTDINNNNMGIINLILEIPQLDTSNVTNMAYVFQYCRGLTTIPLLDTSNATSMGYMFQYCTNLKSIPLIDMSRVTQSLYMFSYCSSLTTIPQLDTSNVTNMSAMFSYCSSLTTIPQLNTSKVTSMATMFKNCTNLTNESLNNILAMCANTTSAYTKTKTLKSIGLTSAQATTCQGLSNYQAFLDAGWTTGY